MIGPWLVAQERRSICDATKMPRRLPRQEPQEAMFDTLSIADFEEDDVVLDDIADLESVADLPDNPTYAKSQAVRRDDDTSFRVDLSKPSPTRAVYTVPTVVNFQNWSASSCWQERESVESKQRDLTLSRVLILKNVDVCDHCAVVSAPLTNKFKLFEKGAPSRNAPFKLVLQPGSSCTFEVHFSRPDDEELKLWDNFRDAVVIYTERFETSISGQCFMARTACTHCRLLCFLTGTVLPFLFVLFVPADRLPLRPSHLALRRCSYRLSLAMTNSKRCLRVGVKRHDLSRDLETLELRRHTHLGISEVL